MSKKEEILNLTDEGYNFSEIAKKCGVTRQYVSLVLCGTELSDFRRLDETKCVFPKFVEWWNRNRMTYPKFFARMGMSYHTTNVDRLKKYMYGKRNPTKGYIDKLISATGLTYEEIFYREGD
jgi:transcriptional regulator with XRE-family HTH domain